MKHPKEFPFHNKAEKSCSVPSEMHKPVTFGFTRTIGLSIYKELQP
jgi:hypothetical protein